MKEVSSPWNNSVRIPVYLSVPPGVVLRSLSFAMACPKNMLSFSGAEKGVLLQSKDFVVETQKDVQPPAAGLQVVRLTVTLNESPGEKASIPNGLIVYVNFVVPDKVSGNVVLVENKILGAKTSDGRSLPRERLIAENGRVNILSPEMTPIVACFFYMH
ncbi:MAG: hypothetical protein HY652_02270 [Acidobacteria bacterium]|nr:hypothetical protein [Acidobacteriota bacterium]